VTFLFEPTILLLTTVFTIKEVIMMKFKNTILLSLSLLFTSNLSQACDIYLDFCLASTLVNNDKIVVGTISNSFTNSVELTIIDVLFGVENNSTVTIWDGSTIECNGAWSNDANDMGNIGDTILCMIEPITSTENPWDVIGEYRRPSLLGAETSTNFSAGWLFDNTYGYSEALSIDMASFCCNRLSEFNLNIYNLPTSTGTSLPITIYGYPEGGTFSGPGIVFSTFNPSLAGPGIHTITYTINGEFSCSFSTQENILVFTIDFNFVNYNLGTISPKITNSINVEVDVPEQDQYTFQVFDLMGKQHFQKTVQFNIGLHLQEIQLNQKLPKGIYLFKIVNNHTYTSKKFVVSGY